MGGDPTGSGSPAEFHDRNAGRVASWPRTMTTLSTHDTKRSEDVRARLAVLAEIPDEWAPRFRRWAAAHPLPDRSLELLAWQNLVGAWPISAERLAAYLGKASKEAKLVTSHVEAVPEVDEAVAAWPAAVLADAELVAEIEQFVARISGPGWSNSLGQKLLQLAGPGVPDVYQGTDLFSTRSSTRTTAGRSTGRRGAALARIDDGWLPDIDADGRRSCWSRRARCGCAGSGRVFAGYRALTADGPAAARGRVPRSPSLVAVATRRRSGSRPAAGGATRCSRCPTAPRTGTTSSPTPPSTAPPHGWPSSWRATGGTARPPGVRKDRRVADFAVGTQRDRVRCRSTASRTP